MALQSMKECRCGNRIPDDWSQCHQCQEWHRKDLYYGTNMDRMERFQMIRVKQKLDKFEVDPTWDEELQDKVLTAVANMAQAEKLADWRKRLKAFQHIQVMWRNAQAHNLDVVDRELGN